MRYLKSALVTIAVFVGTVMPAITEAHHSGAMFDQTKIVALSGVVKQMQWTNPHCWLLLTETAEPGAGEARVWSLEMGPPSVLERAGIRRSAIKVGQALTVHAQLSKDGQPVALFVDALTAEGAKLSMTPTDPGVPR